MIKHYSNILLAICRRNGDVTALDQAANLCITNQAHLSVVEVMNEMPYAVRTKMAFMHLSGRRDTLIARKQQELNNLLAPLKVKAPHIEVNAKVLTGVPHVEIIREVLRNKHDLAMIAGGGSGTIKDLLFGKTEMHLVKKCPSPVWVVKPDNEPGRGRVLAFVNPDPFNTGKMSLSAKVMEASMHLASSEKRELHIILIWSKYPEHILYCYAGVPIKILDNLIDEKQKMRERWIYSFLNKRMPGFNKCRVHFFEGCTKMLIPKVVKEFQPGIVVSGIIPKSGQAEFFTESAVEATLHETGCSVLIVKPEGFESTIQLKDRCIA